MIDSELTRSINHLLFNNNPVSMVTAGEPNGILRNTLLPTSELVHGKSEVVATHPQPGAIGIPLHSLPLESRARSDFDIATIPDHMVRLGGVLVSIEGHRAGEIPVAELGDGSDDEDVVAVFGTDFDGEGEETVLACVQAGEASATGRLMGAVMPHLPPAWIW